MGWLFLAAFTYVMVCIVANDTVSLSGLSRSFLRFSFPVGQVDAQVDAASVP